MFDGLRVLALESRRGSEMATLIRKQGGEAFVAPSMREVALAEQRSAVEFGERLLAGEWDGLVLLTGVGTRLLWKALTERHEAGKLLEALGGVTLIVRGPKPAAALREIGLAPQVAVPEPNTWRELVEAMRGRPEARLAVQEYGKSNVALLDALRAQGRQVTPIRIYAWDLPEDTAPLREAARRLAAGGFDVALFTTSMQVVNLMRLAEEEGLETAALAGLRAAIVGSIGPTTSETLEEYGIQADFEPSHPKMGLLVNELGDAVQGLRDAKRAAR